MENEPDAYSDAFSWASDDSDPSSEEYDTDDSPMDGYSSEVYFSCNLSWRDDAKSINGKTLVHIQNRHARSRYGVDHCEDCDVTLEEPHFVVRVLQGELVEKSNGAGRLEEMDPELWSRLPEDVLGRCLAMLPLDSLHRFSMVSKGWKSVLRSPEFMKLYCELGPGGDPLICAVECNPGRLARCKPRPTDVSYLTPESGALEVHRLEFPRALPDRFKQFHPSCCIVQDGLIYVFKRGNLWEEQGKRAIDLCVLHPMTLQWEELPRHFITFEYNHFVHQRAQLKYSFYGHFQLVVLHSDGSKDLRPALSVYSSKSGTWTKSELEERIGHSVWYDFPDSLEDQVPEWPQYVVSDGLLYLVEMATGDYGVAIRVYNVDDGKFVRLLDSNLGPSKILEHLGRVFLVNQYRSDDASEDWDIWDSSHHLDIGIWELDFNDLSWQKTTALPEHLWRVLMESPGDAPVPQTLRYLTSAVLAGQNLCLSVGEFEEPKTFRSHLVAYDVDLETWSIVYRGLDRHRLSSDFCLFSPVFREFVTKQDSPDWPGAVTS